MTDKKPKRKLIDWESIEPLFRLGTLSNYQICTQYAEDHKNSQVWKIEITEGSIRNRAKAKGWKKNIADKVQRQIQERVLRNSLRKNDELRNDDKILSDQEIIDQVAEIASGVLLRHREEIKAMLLREDALLLELDGAKDIDLKEKTIILKNICAVRSQRIALERQAYNIKDDTEPDIGGEDRVWTINGIRAQPRVIE